MIYIDLSDYNPPANWIQNANVLKLQLLGIANDENQIKNFIRDNAGFWSEIKNTLPHSDKCWISEAKDSVSPYTVEHFRPKLKVSRTDFKKMKLTNGNEAQRNDWTKANKYAGVGYWWLAFDYNNFRICGSLINGTKANRFPLRLGSQIAYSDADNHEDEIVILLDPTKQDDPNLITFNPDGKVSPSDTDDTSENFIRAYVSIQIYGLNKIPPLVEHRQAKWDMCLLCIKNANSLYPIIEPLINGTTELNDFLENSLEAFYSNINKLKEFISPNSEFSVVSKTCLLSFKNKYAWIDDFVLN